MAELDIYNFIENEIRDGIYDEELWKKALEDNNNNEVEAKREYIEFRAAQLKQNDFNPSTYIEEDPSSDPEFSPSREPVKKRNIAIGITILFFLIVLLVVLGFLLDDYFN